MGKLKIAAHDQILNRLYRIVQKKWLGLKIFTEYYCEYLPILLFYPFCKHKSLLVLQELYATIIIGTYLRPNILKVWDYHFVEKQVFCQHFLNRKNFFIKEFHNLQADLILVAPFYSFFLNIFHHNN